MVFCCMKIAVVSVFPPYRGGIAQFNEAMADAFTAEGHECIGFNFSRQYPGILFPGTKQYEEGQVSRFVHATAIDSINPLSWRHCAKTVAKEQPDIVVIPFWTAFLAPALASVVRQVKTLHRSVRIVGLFHNANSHDARPWEKMLTQRLLQHIDEAWTLSEDVSKQLAARRNDLRITTAFHPLYRHFRPLLSRSESRNRLGLPEAPKMVLFFGLIRPYKGLEWLLKAGSELLKTDENICFCIAGEPYTAWESYQLIIDNSPSPERFHTHLRFIPQDEVHVFFSAADLVCLPYSSASQSGVTAIAMHYHKPVVATDVGGLKEYFEGNPIGHICAPKDVSSLTAAIQKALIAQTADTEIIDAWNEKFSWAAFAQKCLPA
ncbi:MAG: hypothetical protein CMD33_00860 [Flavobacteriales bacterium]|nr:hypothetical protein [Flavobacteriales bacterium]